MALGPAGRCPVFSFGFPFLIEYFTGWWYTYHLEKYEFVNGKDYISHIYEMENNPNVPNHQPGYINVTSTLKANIENIWI